MSLETVLEIFEGRMLVGIGIFELRVWRGDSLQSWRFGVAFGVNIPPLFTVMLSTVKR